MVDFYNLWLLPTLTYLEFVAKFACSFLKKDDEKETEKVGTHTLYSDLE